MGAQLEEQSFRHLALKGVWKIIPLTAPSTERYPPPTESESHRAGPNRYHVTHVAACDLAMMCEVQAGYHGGLGGETSRFGGL